jgi:hypothetical protein
MKKFKPIYFTVLLLLIVNFTFCQKPDKKQVAIGREFLNFVINGQNEEAWQLFDKINVPEVAKDNFNSAITQIGKDLVIFDSFNLVMTGIKFIENKQVSFYTFRALSKTKNIVDEISIDLLFFDSSNLVAGMQPKKLQKENSASTSKGKETPLEQNFTAVINDTTYTVRGINIVHFSNNNGLLTIQIEMKLAENEPHRQQWAKNEAVRFVRYLVGKGYVEKAKVKARELGRVMLEDIGVSFYDSSIGGGFNVMLKPGEY